MDGLSAGASIIAVIQITVSIASVLSDYYCSVRDARSDIYRLYHSIKSLQTILTAIRNLNIGYKDRLLVSKLVEDPNGPLQVVWVELKTLEGKLGKSPNSNERTARWLRSLKWPFQKGDIKKITSAIESNKSTLILDYTVENV
jgi:hypothetical protein